MVEYGLILLLFVLLGVAGLQFTYLFYVGKFDDERKKHVRHLERKCIQLTERLEAAETRLADQEKLIDAAYPELRKDDEAWADVIEDR